MNGKRHDRKGTVNNGLLKSRKDGFDPIRLHSTLVMDLQTSGLPLSSRDIATVNDRFAAEGWSFLAVTLKELGKALLTLLETGTMPPHTFKCDGKPGNIPLLYKGLWRMLVKDDGQLDDSTDPSRLEARQRAVKALLQLTTCWSKYEAMTPMELLPRYLDEFVETDAAIPSLIQMKGEPAADVSTIISIARSIITRVFDGVDVLDIIPRHGPGAVASGEKAEEKWTFKRRFHSLDSLYPFEIYHLHWAVDWDASINTLARLTHIEWIDSPTAKIHVVPKDSASLRIISAEPLEVMFVQQGQMDLLVHKLESHPLTRGYVNFTDQSINGRLALEASMPRSPRGRYATLDLSSASDRLSLELVMELFRGNEELLAGLLASRSRRTKLPDGREVTLRKFAPMGSAVCFPVQSVVFYALALASISLASDISYSEMLGSVYVYGDDIIVDTHFVYHVIEALEGVGLKVNTNKSFYRGLFRESCGVFAYAGADVTPVRFKQRFPTSQGNGSGWAAWVKYAHHLEGGGYWQSADVVYSWIEAFLGPLPYGTSESSYFCRLGHRPSAYGLALQNRATHRVRWNADLQCGEIRAWGIQVGWRQAAFPDWWTRLFRSLLTSFLDPSTDPDRVVIPSSTKTKLGWHLLR